LSSLAVVVPTRDTREMTLRCLQALHRDRGSLREVTLVDDGSSDGTAAAASARFPDLRVLRLERSRGFAAAANAGVDAVEAEVVWLLNSDTEVLPGAATALLAAFAADEGLGIAGPVLCTPGGEPAWSGGREPGPLWLFALASGLGELRAALRARRGRRPRVPASREVDWVTGAALAIRGVAWREVGPLDEGFAFYGQDVDLCLRARDRGWRVRLVAEARVVHLEGGTIGRQEGAVAGRRHPALLWADLARCVEKRSGRSAGARARGALYAGALLRLAARRLATPLVPASRGAAYARDTRAYADALARLVRRDQGGEVAARQRA
jgi:hypothetical protein